MTDNANTHRLEWNGKDVLLLGTAHVSRESAELVSRVIREERPETVCVELCQPRYQALVHKDQWKDTDLVKVIREKKSFLLLANLMLASFQKKIAGKFGIKPGEEMLRAVEAAREVGAEVHLADREIRTTLARTWRLMGFWTKIKLLAQFIASFGDVDTIREEDIEEMKQKDVLETLLSEMGQALPELRRILIDERDQYLACKIRTAPGSKIVAVVGAGHVPGIRAYWEKPVDMDALEQLPPKGRLSRILKWAIPAAVVALVALGFFYSGFEGGAHMVKWWILATAVLAGVGAAAALAHPLTILAAMAAAPITTLHPLIAAGWVAGLVEAVIGKPKVGDFEQLPEDITSVKGFWKNKITRILLVVALTNVGSSLGVFVAIPLMMKAFG